MMDVPRLPTDNLYKFGTLCGVALLVAGVMCVRSALEAREQLPRDEAAINSMIDPAEDLHLELRFKHLDKRLWKAIQNQETAPEEKRDSIQDEIQDLFEKAYKVGLRRVRRSHDNERYALELKALIARGEGAGDGLRIGAILIGVGVGFTLLGLCLWYFLHQRYQDRILRETAYPRVNTACDESRDT